MSHDHPHLPVAYGRAFVIGITLNLGFVLIEAWYGWQADSLALLADAGHNLSDVGGLALAWAAYGAAKLQPNSRHTYGWRKASVLASFTNAAVLLIAMGSLALEAAHRLDSPSPVESQTVMAVAGVGVVINAATAWLFASGQRHDLNIRGAFVHMMADALISAGVVIAGALSWWQGWLWIDPVVSLLIATVIVLGTWALFRQSLHLLFDGVPEGVDADRVHQRLSALPGVVQVHDLHIWALSTTDNALTAHLVLDEHTPTADHLLTLATTRLRDEFEIRHATLQVEGQDYAQTCPTAQCAQPRTTPHSH
jgi:cobalt-zinc-cadmium efflux system protein